MPLLAVHYGVTDRADRVETPVPTDLAAQAEGLDLTAAGDNVFVRAVRRARQEAERRQATQSLDKVAGFDSRLPEPTAMIAGFDNRA